MHTEPTRTYAPSLLDWALLGAIVAIVLAAGLILRCAQPTPASDPTPTPIATEAPLVAPTPPAPATKAPAAPADTAPTPTPELPAPGSGGLLR